ncbi:MAG: hypothetical protein HUU20_21290, partial [Pirellulales bacterium]|nr:hypothetical protein [Pirellulales bacterium]
CLRNMFEEERAGNPGPLDLSVSSADAPAAPEAGGGWLATVKKMISG